MEQDKRLQKMTVIQIAANEDNYANGGTCTTATYHHYITDKAWSFTKLHKGSNTVNFEDACEAMIQ